MRISNSNIPTQTSRLGPVSSRQAEQASERRQQAGNRVGDNNSNNSAPVIEAEYVDLYSPNGGVFNMERQGLDVTLEPEQTQKQNMGKLQIAGKYQLGFADAPPPGTYIDIFA